jgi:hypothetical protein
MANHTICDPSEERVFADVPADATCPECLEVHAREGAEWYAELRERLDREEDTAPGKRRR